MSGRERSWAVRKRERRPALDPARYTVLAYVAAVLVGFSLLKLPQASASGEPLTWIDALFTATSAVCVTGLTVVSTAHDLSLFGQGVILALMEIGGLGVMTMGTFFILLLGRRIRLQDRLLIQQDLNQSLLSGVIRLVRRVIAVSVFLQSLGAVALYLSLRNQFESAGRAAFFAVFHAVSGFANAGFDLFGDSLEGMAGNFAVTATIVLLLVVGGLGFAVLEDVRQFPKTRKLTLHSRVVLATSAGLLAGGALLALVLEGRNPGTLGPMSGFGKVWHAFFLSATSRTAGFNTVPTGLLSEATLFALTGFMFVGASPGSTGGGIKTTTLATLLASFRATVKGLGEVRLFDRRLPPDAVSRALTIALMAFFTLVLAVFALTLTETAPLLPIFFEAVSAFATVGLSTGITSDLSEAGKAVLITLMLIGRVGPMTVALALARRTREETRFRLPEERLPLG